MRRLALSTAAAGLLAFSVALGPTAAASTMPAADGTAPATTSAQEPIGGALMGKRGLVIDKDGGAAPLPQVEAEAYVVSDATTGEVLAAKGPHVLHRPASTLKTLTALTALNQELDLDTTYTAQAADTVVEGTHVGLVEGSTYTLRDLMYGMFVKSGNDAATAVAHLGGGVQPFVARMNEMARALQANDTTAVGPSGLDEPGQLTSAYDLALIGRAALARTEITEWATTKVYPFPDKNPAAGKKRGSYDIFSIQRFVLNYPEALGIKNGYTTLAQQTLIAASHKNGRTVLVTLMHSGSDVWREAIALSEWAYANAEKVEPVGQLVEPIVTPTVPEEFLTVDRSSVRGAAEQKVSPTTAFVLAGVLGSGSAGGVLWFGRRARTRRLEKGTRVRKRDRVGSAI